MEKKITYIDEKLERNRKYSLTNGSLNFSLNVAGMNFTDKELDELKVKFTKAHAEMKKIEAGEIKNPDENRKVTHFTDRAAYPHEELFAEVESFAESIRNGEIKSSTGKKFKSAVINGIGGSALGPELMQLAINGPYWNEKTEFQRKNNLKIYFVDNTDPAGIRDILDVISLEETLVVNISKSGGTQETKNNIVAFDQAFERSGLKYNQHACAITMETSNLDREVKKNKWIKVFHMSESIGGRTSETSIVGHLPAALAGINFKSFIDGACKMDTWTRAPDYKKNPAYLLAAMWYLAGNGKGDKNMVIVPFSDRLISLPKYLQQLVMESLGKNKDRDGNVVNQGLNVFGNKGGTDAHAYIQQLNDGRNDFFITFIEVLKDSMNIPISEGITMGDYLHGFKAGLSNALEARKRQVIQIQINEVSSFSLGMLIALYERTVAVYAELININAFHQPGVQAYKLASKGIIKLMTELESLLYGLAPWIGTIDDFCKKTELESIKVEIEGVLAKFAENADTRSFNKFKITREWDNTKGWIYSLKKGNQ